MELTIPLDDDLSTFVQSQVANGQYASSLEVVREALQLLRSFDAERSYSAQELKRAWQVGIESGDAGEIDFEALKKEARQRPMT